MDPRGARLPRPTALVWLCLIGAIALGACGDDATTDSHTPPLTPEADSADVPAEFPPPPEATDYQELTVTSDQIQVQWETSLSAMEAVEFYGESLSEQDWEVSSQREGGDSTRFAINGHGWVGAVTVLGGDPVRVLLQLGVPDDE